MDNYKEFVTELNLLMEKHGISIEVSYGHLVLVEEKILFAIPKNYVVTGSSYTAGVPIYSVHMQ